MATYNQREAPDSKKYISDADESAFCDSLKESSSLSFVTYIMYKIIAFIATFAD
jgi:hypothetical protein